MKYSPRLSRPARLLVPLLAGALAAVSAPVPAAARTPAPPAHPPARTSCGRPDSGPWAPTATRIDPADSHHAYVGNGYLGQRVPPNGMGYAEPGGKTGWPLFTPRYDGSFVSGLYAHNPQTTEDRQVIAALPTWTGLEVRTGGKRAETFGPGTPPGRISHYRQSLLLRCGLVRTSLTWTAADGRATDLVYEVLAHRTAAHVGAVRLRMTPHWTGRAAVTDVLDGRGARRLTQTGGGARPGGRTVDVAFRTDGTKVDGAVASTLRPGPGVRTQVEHQRRTKSTALTARQTVGFPVRAGRGYELTKYVGVDTALSSRTPRAAATAASQRAARTGWHRLLATHRTAWRKLWHTDIEVPGQPELQAWVRSAEYGLLAAARPGARNSIAPTGLTSDNYAGLIFWDAETWMFPSLLAGHPELARTVVEYRYRTRTAARANARRLGYRGLFYPWNSGSRGDLRTECHSVDPPHCRTQIHLQSDIALAVWQYYLATGDTDWLRRHGWPVLKGIAEFWSGRVTPNSDGSYSIKDVAGPDEYSNGVDDGVFTNAGAATTLRTATRAARLLGESAPAGWDRIADRLRIPYDAEHQVFQQYAGYQGSVIKQADTVLLMYPLEWPMSRQAAANTLDYYAARTDPDGPAMTDSVHAVDAAAIGEPGCVTHTYLTRAIRPFVRGPFNLFSEARGTKAGASDPLAGSPAQDFLTGKGGFLQVFLNGLTGLRQRADRVHLDPMLPPQLAQGVTLRGLRWQGRGYEIALGAHHTTVRLTSGEPFRIDTPQGEFVVSAHAPVVLKTRRPDLEPTDNVARCTAATASSEEPGMYAPAALDGNTTTAWVPDGVSGTLTADLGDARRISAVTPVWTAVRPVAYTVRTSVDGVHWTAPPGARTTGLARYVRVTLRSADDTRRAGVAELTVRGAGSH
ncbi:haloacid dehalogenase [Streptomyces albus subsp. albus]|nr:haloacid dehalogenase [Streptomyces albus subsp. albus]